MNRPDVPQTPRGSELPVPSEDPGFERIRARNLLFEYVNGVNERGMLPAVRERMCYKLHQGPELPISPRRNSMAEVGSCYRLPMGS